MAEDCDEYDVAAAQALQERHSWKLQTLANMEAYKAQGDLAGMQDEVVRLGKIEQEIQGIRALQHQHWASKQPRPQGPGLSPEMQAAKPAHMMTHEDTYRMAMQGVKSEREAQAIHAGFMEGMREVERRKARGE